MERALLEEFTAARWKSLEEARTFVERAKPATPEDIIALLDILTGKKITPNSPSQATRVRLFYDLAAKVTGKGLFDAYLKGLRLDDKNLRGALAMLLPEVADPPFRPRLVDLLKNTDPGLRKVAAQVLRKIADPNILRPVGEMFRDRNFPGRAEAIELAGAIPGPHSLEILRMVVESGKGVEKVRALKYLLGPEYLKGNTRMILAAIRPALHDTDEAVLAEAIPGFAALSTEEEFFDSVGDYLHHENLRLVRAAVDGLRHFSSERTISALERKLFTGPTPIRLAVLDSVEHISHPGISKVILKALEHKNNAVREKASQLLTRLTRDGKIKVSQAMYWLLRGEDPSVRKMAVTLAQAYPDKAAELWGEVLDQFRTEDWWVRQRLVGTLSDLGGGALVPYILANLNDPSDIFRRFLLELLVGLDSPASAAAVDAVLKTALEDENWWVREKAVEVLATLKATRTIPVLLEIAEKNPHFRVVVLEGLRTMGAKELAPRVASYLSSPNPDVRIAALNCLESFDDRSMAEAIIPLFKDRDGKVRQRAKDLGILWNLSTDTGDALRETTLPLIDRLLISVRNAHGDDLILLPDNPPYIKKHGRTIQLFKNVLTNQQIQSLLMPLLSPHQKEGLARLEDIDLSYEVRSENLRFRANIFTSRTGMSAVFRIIKGEILALEQLGLPSVVQSFGEFKNGLVLVGGPTGSGKSTTLSTIIAHINRTSRRHVISIEDPIEAVHQSSTGLINQREVGVHTPSFDHALKMILREDPDVILVGEMRDLPTIQFAVTAAETGHLVFGTVHTVSADATVDRLVNAYPAESQEQVRSMLADSLRAVLCQYLIRQKESEKMVLATEIMINNNAIGNLIRKGKTFQIPSVIVTSREMQMQLMDQSLMDLYKEGKISAEEAYLKARTKSDFEELVGEGGAAGTGGGRGPAAG